MKIVTASNEKSILDVVNFAGDDILLKSLRKEKNIFIKIKKIHFKNNDKINETKSECKKIWKEKGRNFLRELERIFGIRLKNDKIVNVNSIFNCNIANVMEGKNIFINISGKGRLSYYLFHELVHLYYIDALENLSFKDINEAGKSPLMEGIDHLILFKTPIRNLFSIPRYKEIGFVDTNKKFMNSLDELWQKRKDFKSFVEEAIKLNKKTKNVIIC
jgi:hypothetical protein